MAASSRFVFPYQQAIDSTGAPIPGALLHFYINNTDTPQDTYSNPGLTIPNTNPVEADGGGYFPAIFLDTTLYSVLLTDANGVEIWSADDVQTPSTPNASTTVPGLIEIATLAEALAGTDTSRAIVPYTAAAAIQQGFGFGAGGGTANAITTTLSPTLTAYASGMEIELRAGSTNTGAVTLNVDGLGAIAVKKVTTQGNTALVAGDIISGITYKFTYDANSACFWITSPKGTQPELGPSPVTSQGDAAAILTQADRNHLNLFTITVARTATLPAASAVPSGTMFPIRNSAASTYSAATLPFGAPLTISRAGSDTIDNSLTSRIIYPGQTAILVSDGTSKWETYSISSPYLYVSSNTAVGSAGATVTFAHGFGVVPKHVDIYLVCNSADANWAANDAPLYGSMTQCTSTTDNRGIIVFADATNVSIVNGSNASFLQFLDKSTGAGTTLTLANWRYRIVAWV